MKKNIILFKKGLISATFLLMSVLTFTGCNNSQSDVGTTKADESVVDKTQNETSTSNKSDSDKNSKETTAKEETTASANDVHKKHNTKSDVLDDEFIDKLDFLLQMVDTYYLYDYDKETVQDTLYKAIFDSLGDPYSRYYTLDEFDKFKESSSGMYSGIGVVVQMDMKTGIITAVKPYKNCPGYEAGIRPGDIIVKVAGTEVTGMDLDEAVALIRGEEGTTVTITLLRDEEIFDVEVTRRKIEIETVVYEMLDDNIGYIQVEEFDDLTDEQFSVALDELQKEGMEGLVIDLRNNPGGILDVVVAMLDDVLPEGVVVSVKDVNGKCEEYKSKSAPKLKVPFVVLVNESSASASEIFAGAVQDFGAGEIIGKTTYGKGIVQSVFSLTDGTGVKITVEDYYTPSGRSIHKLGVTPDVEVDLPDELRILVSIPKEEDTQLIKALEVLKGKLQ